MELTLKEKSIALRQRGLSYSEILKIIPVAKSTLSSWLHSVGLSKKQKQRLTEKKLAAMKRGWLKVHQIKIDRIAKIKDRAKKETKKFINEPYWLIGVILYWAEGAKEKKLEKRTSIS